MFACELGNRRRAMGVRVVLALVVAVSILSATATACDSRGGDDRQCPAPDATTSGTADSIGAEERLREVGAVPGGAHHAADSASHEKRCDGAAGGARNNQQVCTQPLPLVPILSSLHSRWGGASSTPA